VIAGVTPHGVDVVLKGVAAETPEGLSHHRFPDRAVLRRPELPCACLDVVDTIGTHHGHGILVAALA
jgi:hypothetical protein